jgi:Ca2+/H+ antiporter
MKKRAIEAIILLVISMIGAWILPSFLKMTKVIELPDLDDFIITTLIIFAVMYAVTMSFKQRDREPKLSDGYHEVYNANNQLSKKGTFFHGKQVSGIRNVYKKDGTLSHIEKCVDGIYTADK